MKTFQQMSEQCILFLFSTTLGIGSSFSHHLGSGKEQQDIDLTSRFRKWCGSSMKSQLINSKVLLLFNNCRIESCAFTNFFLIFFCQAKWDSSCNWNSLANDGLEFFLEDTSSMRFVREWKVIWNHLKSIKHCFFRGKIEENCSFTKMALTFSIAKLLSLFVLCVSSRLLLWFCYYL